MGLRPTRRGLALAGSGGAGVLAGTVLASPALVQVGLLAALAVLAAVVWLTVELLAEHRGRLLVARRVPQRLHVADIGTVTVSVTARRGRVDRLHLAERAAAELSRTGRPRARVRRTPLEVTITYPVVPTHRGRWPLGPLEVLREDPFGLVVWRGPLGDQAQLPVRPAVTDLAGSADRTGSLDQVTAGAGRPSADDAALREYHPGDDLRRVHWASSARRGEVVVRRDEGGAPRPVTILIDVPTDDAGAERVIAAAASIAVELAPGRPVRLVGCGGAVDGDVEALLDHTVDLCRPPDRETARLQLRAAVDGLVVGGYAHDPVVALLGAQQPAELGLLGALAQGWALLLDDGDALAGGELTATGLRRLGWRVERLGPQAELASAWHRLLTAGATR